MTTSLYVALALYLLLLVVIGLWAAARTRNAEDFFLAGRRGGLWAIGLATMAASFSSFVFLGGPGLTYSVGVGAFFITLPVGFTAGLLCRSLAPELRRLAGEGVLTIPEALGRRFPGRSVPALAAVAILLGSIAYLGLQLQGIALLLRVLMGVEDPRWALLVAVGVMLLYSVAGGMVAGLYTDVLQGVLMLIAAAVVFLRVAQTTGGWSAWFEALRLDRGDAFLIPQGSLPLMTVLGFFFVFGVGVLGQPHLVHKFMMLRDPKQLRYLPAVFGGSQLVCLSIWFALGLGVPALVAQGKLAPLAQPDMATPTFLVTFLPPALAGLLVAGVFAAVMSTADSFLNLGAAALVRDLPRAFGRQLSHELRWSRVAVLLIAAIASLFAVVYADLIALVGTFAFGAFAAALAPVLVCGFGWRQLSSRAAAWSIVVGLSSALLLEFFAKQNWFSNLPKPPLVAGAMPSAVALALSFATLALAASFRNRDAVDGDG